MTLKEEIEMKTRKLKPVWTPEMVANLKVTHGLDLESELATILAEEIEKEMVILTGKTQMEREQEIVDQLRALATVAFVGSRTH